MFAAIRRDRAIDPIRRDEVAQRLTDGVVPLLSGQDGFVASYVVIADDGAVITVAIFSEREGAHTASHRTAVWVKSHLHSLLPDSADLVFGEIWHGISRMGHHEIRR